MHIDLVESLRCVRQHELTWLVAVAERVEGRHIVSGMLGCPECRAEYPIVRGVARFTPPEPGAEPPPRHPPSGVDEVALRAAALLDLTTPGGLVVLAGEWSVAAAGLAALAEGLHVLALNAAQRLQRSAALSLATALRDVPVRPGTSRGVALDEPNASPTQLSAGAEALRAGGRLIAPASAPVPPGVTVLVRDERHWVAERTADAGPVVQLGLSRRDCD